MGYKEEVLLKAAQALGAGKVIGARVLVEDIAAEDEVTARAKKAGLAVVVYENNVPKPTEGIVLGYGKDPIFEEEGLQIGDHVFFSKHAGHHVYDEGKEYRSLELQEITRIKPRSFYGWKEDEESNLTSS